MAGTQGIEFDFDDAEDAAAYLAELRRLWTAWAVGLAALFLTTALLVFAAAIFVIGALLVLARPLQRRAERISPAAPRVRGDDKGLIPGRGVQRDRVLRALAYGEEPLRRAVEVAGASPIWLLARRAILGVTLAAFVGVLIQAGR